ncbi:MAG TPA: hypothetical protein VLQ93_03280 [Myxococcaceae bacterium]|nr:hypothetical protein [Myxococcaceae bacterium]
MALWALPSGAELLGVHRPLAPPPELPERPAFEELLLSFADPEQALEGGFTVPSLSLAVRARAWAFVRPEAHEERDAWDALALPAQELSLADLPGGGHLASLLELGPEARHLRVKELGPWLRGPGGPLHEALDDLPGPRAAAVLTGGAVALGLIYQFGTPQAAHLGLPAALSGTLLGGRLHASVQLHSEPRFQNARAEVETRFRLPELPLLGEHLEVREVGGTVARTPERLLLDTRWASLRARLTWLELSLGVRSSQDEPGLWMDLETNVRREHLGLHAVFSRQWETARSRATATATLRTGPVLTGLFLGVQGTSRHTFGLVSMGTF